MIKFIQDIDLTDINDSLELESGQIIATLEKDGIIASLEVHGHVTIDFNERTYNYYSEFPDTLKSLIHSGDYLNDPRVYVSENNWFEVFIYHGEDDPGPLCDVVDVENLTPAELFDTLLDWVNEEIKDNA